MTTTSSTIIPPAGSPPPINGSGGEVKGDHTPIPSNRIASEIVGDGPVPSGAPATPEATPTTTTEQGGKTAQPTVLAATPSFKIDTREIGLSAFLLIAWVTFLTAGITVGAQPYIGEINGIEHLGTREFLWCGFVILTCYTIPNLAFLCCLATFLGVIGARTIGEPGPQVEPQADRLTAYASAITRGFFVYMIFLSGSIMVSEEALTHITMERYVRLAGLASLISFTTGYNPELFRRLLQRFDNTPQLRPEAAVLKGSR